jgi:hypothetical protein
MHVPHLLSYRNTVSCNLTITCKGNYENNHQAIETKERSSHRLFAGEINDNKAREEGAKCKTCSLYWQPASLKSDFNTGNLTYHTSRATTVEVKGIIPHHKHTPRRAHIALAAFKPHAPAVCTLPWAWNEAPPP